MHRKALSDAFHTKALSFRFSPKSCCNSLRTVTLEAGEGHDHMYKDVPQSPKSKSERKPYITPMKILIQRAKVEKEARKAQPCRMLEERPDNGLLVPELVNIAHQVYRSREILLSGLSKLVKRIPVQRCRYCSEIHIGQTGHEIRTCMGTNSGSRDATHVWKRGGTHDVICFPSCFHLNDRVGKPRVGHDERNTIRRIPAILELCIQAGVDLDQYPTKRRTKPVYSIEGRIVDFESVAEMEESERDLEINSTTTEDTVKNILQLDNDVLSQMQPEPVEEKSLRGLSIMTLKSWFEMISGAKKIMEKYKVHTCGYCPEVQVGPKGHKVRKCKASKHQTRNGLHAWQEATIDDIVGPNYVWHVPDLSGPPLVNNLKRFYGKAPAVVELCVHGGAPIPDEYRSMMRLDVVSPNRDEVDLVA